MRHPVQPLEKDPNDILRFKKNAIVRYLLDAGPFDMNHLACIDFSQEDSEQFAQLIGYSLGGFGELSYVSNETYSRAESGSEVIAVTSERESVECNCKLMLDKHNADIITLSYWICPAHGFKNMHKDVRQK